jgi:hypothetical protein
MYQNPEKIVYKASWRDEFFAASYSREFFNSYQDLSTTTSACLEGVDF